MNCPKCNSPINEGDKFCQTCGSMINNQPPQQPVVGPNIMPSQNVEQPTPVVQQPVPNTPNPVNQQPMNQVGNIPQEPKNNNTIVLILGAVIVILIAVVVWLLLFSGEKEPVETNDEQPKTEQIEEEKPTEEEVVASKYNKTKVNEYTFELPTGYSASYDSGYVIVNNDDMNTYAIFSNDNKVYSNVDLNVTKANIEAYGITNLTYVEKKLNNKRFLVYSGKYMNYDIEFIFVEYSPTKILGIEVHYRYNSNNYKNDMYDIITRTKVEDASFSTTTITKIPGLDMSALIK